MSEENTASIAIHGKNLTEQHIILFRTVSLCDLAMSFISLYVPSTSNQFNSEYSEFCYMKTLYEPISI